MKGSGSSKVVYAIVLTWPEGSVLKLGAPVTSKATEVTMLGYQGPLKWTTAPFGQGLYVTMSNIPWNKLPSITAWVLKITNVSN